MSKLLEEIIADLKARRIEYEEYLKRIAEVAKHVQRGQAEDTPEPLKNSAGLRALYNNLLLPANSGAVSPASDSSATYGGPDPKLSLALAIDEVVRRERQDAWRDNDGPREKLIKRALLPLLNNSEQEVERIFHIIKQQPEY
ncbi:MAG: hypothetical protein HY550_06085 [Elusimicrobia bacterium]|nr:hypothetical protein [Elusimicrobiota bacterium]